MALDPFNRNWIESGKIMAGSLPTSEADIRAIHAQGIRAILSLARRSILDIPGISGGLLKELDITWVHVPFEDGGVPDADESQAIEEFLTEMTQNNIPVFIHCRGGFGRTYIALWLYYRQNGMQSPDILNKVRNHRPRLGPYTDIQRAFVEYNPTPNPPPKQEKKPMYKNNLENVTRQIAGDFDLDADELLDYMKEDPFTGWDEGKGEFPIGSLWTVEGNILYALIRATKPDKVLELGRFVGASTCHIALALRENGGGAVVMSIDHIARDLMIPDDLLGYVDLQTRDALDYLKRSRTTWGFVYEDMLHSPEQVQAVWESVKVAKGGFLVSHDACHYIVGEQVRAGIEATDRNASYYLASPSDCGLAVWRNM